MPFVGGTFGFGSPPPEVYPAAGELLLSGFAPAVTLSCSVTLDEFFANGINDYSTVSGDRTKFTVAADTYGDTLSCAAQTSGTVSRISRTFNVCLMNEVTFKFCVTAGNPDDSAGISFNNTTNGYGQWYFLPRRETAIDGASRPHFFWKNTSGAGLTDVALGAGELVIGDWYEAHIYFSAGTMYLSLENLTAGTPAVDYTISATANKLPCQELFFNLDSGNTTCPTKYADIQVT